MSEQVGKRSRRWWVAVLCGTAFFAGGFYGCHTVMSAVEPFGREFMVMEYVGATQSYLKGWHETGTWPAANDVIYSDLQPVGSRQEKDGRRIDTFASPYPELDYLEFHLREDGRLSIRFVETPDVR